AANGALAGLMYGLVALGVVLIYKCSAVVNFAQGSMVMFGAFITWFAAGKVGIPVWLAVLLSVLVMSLVGLGIERIALRRMIGQPLIMIIMLTLGLDILIRGFGPVFFGTGPYPLRIGISEAPVAVGEILLSRTYLIGGAVALLLMMFFIYFFQTRYGVVLRAVSDDYIASWAVGISVERAIGLSWGLSGAVATFSGALWGSVQGVDWTLSLLLMKALAVAILGGLDSLGGVMLAGVMIGTLENVISGYLDPVVGGGTKEVVSALIILLTILIKPYGFFGREIIERV
ncbi:MAG: branched-chain amino acid ABC transporter permease, partial [Deltaproteobacteria bacterium]|nr:branched-chain amino acid ABC transporter permease [Deltaproteobacteria bacterium]